MSFPDKAIATGYPGINKNFGKPWYGIQYSDPYNVIYSTNISPLNPDNWLEITQNGQPLSGLRTGAKDIIKRNQAILDASKEVNVVLDGRVNIFNQGYLGDLVEATRIIDPLLISGKKVRIITSHGDIFSGSGSDSVEVRGIPSDIPPANQYPWDQRLLRFIGQNANLAPTIFPVNARVPIAFNIDRQGTIKNGEEIDYLNKLLNQSTKQIGIRHEKWSKRGVHQLQALQAFSYLLGMDSLNWSQFPEAFFYPDDYSVKVADEVIGYYHCFYSRENKTPLLLHPGVATDGRKIDLKGYPEEKWKDVITAISESQAPVDSLTMLKPVDQDQSQIAGRLIKHAEKNGFNVSEVPMEDILKNYGWSFGSFVSFLQELSMRRGIILGCDSMPAGHAGPATNIRAVVLGSPFFNPTFFGPAQNSLIVMPRHDLEEHNLTDVKDLKTKHIKASQVVAAINSIAQ
jgi:hypothetical protein